MFAKKIIRLFSILRQGIWGFVPLLILVLYTYAGALIFRLLEAQNEIQKLERSLEYHEQIIKDAAKKIVDSNNDVETVLEILQDFRNSVANDSYLNILPTSNKSGVYKFTDVAKWKLANNTKWTIWGGIYFAMTIYTTIGYGNVYPETWGGRIATIIYGLIGIPLALISLIALGSLLARFWLWIWLMLVRAVGCLSGNLQKTLNVIVPVDKAHANTNNKNDHEELLQFPLTFLLFLILFWVVFSAMLFNWWLEKPWSFSESLYFILVSFMTIGFGDYIPSKYDNIILVGFLLLGGLSLISALITILQTQIGAIATSMKTFIDKEYVQEFSDFLQGITEIHIEGNNGNPYETRILTKMAWRRRAVYNMMSKERKKQLREYMEMKLQRVNRGVQTDPFLMDKDRRSSLNVFHGVVHHDMNMNMLQEILPNQTLPKIE